MPTDDDNQLGEIRPDSLYPLPVFIRMAGIPRTRLHTARQQGVVPKCIKVGKRKYVRGVDAIEFIERLAQAA